MTALLLSRVMGFISDAVDGVARSSDARELLAELLAVAPESDLEAENMRLTRELTEARTLARLGGWSK